MFGVNNINFTFKIKDIIFLIFTIFIIGTLFALGFWQVGRMKWKNELIAKVENFSYSSPVSIDFFLNRNKEDLIFKTVILPNSIVENFSLYSYSYKNKEAHYDVFNILELPINNKFLIKRNFFFKKIGSQIPIQTKDTITAFVLEAPKKNIFTPSNNFIDNLIFNLDITSINNHYNQNLREDIYLIQFDESEKDTIIQNILANIHNQHKLYAITWFSLGFIIIIMVLVKFYFINKSD